MEFGPLPLAEAEGAILAHSLALPGGRLRKGRVLTAEDLAALAAAGHRSVTAARLAPGDLGEDAAAARLAAALSGPGVAPGPAATGRVNLFADGPGLARVNAAAIHAANAVDPMLTVATVPPWQRMGRGGMVATVKVISYGVPERAVAAAEAAGAGALALAPPVLRTARLIETVTDPSAPRTKGRTAVAARLERLGVALAPAEVVPHAAGPLAAALAAAREELILVLTASATSDIRDTAPEAVRAAGGQVSRFGLPVDPGNLLFLGAIGPRPVIGLPGCARSPALNGADWIMERVICGHPPDDAAIAAMGVGGLLKDIPERGRPRL